MTKKLALSSTQPMGVGFSANGCSEKRSVVQTEGQILSLLCHLLRILNPRWICFLTTPIWHCSKNLANINSAVPDLKLLLGKVMAYLTSQLGHKDYMNNIRKTPSTNMSCRKCSTNVSCLLPTISHLHPCRKLQERGGCLRFEGPSQASDRTLGTAPPPIAQAVSSAHQGPREVWVVVRHTRASSECADV